MDALYMCLEVFLCRHNTSTGKLRMQRIFATLAWSWFVEASCPPDRGLRQSLARLRRALNTSERADGHSYQERVSNKGIKQLMPCQRNNRFVIRDGTRGNHAAQPGRPDVDARDLCWPWVGKLPRSAPASRARPCTCSASDRAPSGRPLPQA